MVFVFVFWKPYFVHNGLSKTFEILFVLVLSFLIWQCVLSVFFTELKKILNESYVGHFRSDGDLVFYSAFVPCWGCANPLDLCHRSSSAIWGHGAGKLVLKGESGLWKHRRIVLKNYSSKEDVEMGPTPESESRMILRRHCSEFKDRKWIVETIGGHMIKI